MRILTIWLHMAGSTCLLKIIIDGHVTITHWGSQSRKESEEKQKRTATTKTE